MSVVSGVGVNPWTQAECGAFWEQEGIQYGGQDGLESGQRPDLRALRDGFDATISHSRYPQRPGIHGRHPTQGQSPDSQGCSQQEDLPSHSPAEEHVVLRMPHICLWHPLSHRRAWTWGDEAVYEAEEQGVAVGSNPALGGWPSRPPPLLPVSCSFSTGSVSPQVRLHCPDQTGPGRPQDPEERHSQQMKAREWLLLLLAFPGSPPHLPSPQPTELFEAETLSLQVHTRLPQYDQWLCWSLVFAVPMAGSAVGA